MLAIVGLLVAALHVATPAALAWHAGEHVGHGAEVSGESSHHDDSGEDLPCDLCRHLSAVATTPAIAPPVASVTIDVTSFEYAFTPRVLLTTADAQRRPSAPRAPPVL